MPTQTIAEPIRWQDLKVRSEIDIVLEIAKKKGWKDCEVFGYGDMITEPQESMGWKLIPGDLYKYSIPTEAVTRLSQIINAGVRVQGVVIADDERRTEPAPASAPAKPRASLPSVKPVVSWIGNALRGLMRSVRAIMSFSRKVLLGLFQSVGAVVSFSAKALLGLICVLSVIAFVGFAAYALTHFFLPVLALGFLLLVCSGVSLDPKLIILVDDENGGTVWVSLLTWYD